MKRERFVVNDTYGDLKTLSDAVEAAYDPKQAAVGELAVNSPETPRANPNVHTTAHDNLKGIVAEHIVDAAVMPTVDVELSHEDEYRLLEKGVVDRGIHLMHLRLMEEQGLGGFTIAS